MIDVRGYVYFPYLTKEFAKKVVSRNPYLLVTKNSHSSLGLATFLLNWQPWTGVGPYFNIEVRPSEAVSGWKVGR